MCDALAAERHEGGERVCINAVLCQPALVESDDVEQPPRAHPGRLSDNTHQACSAPGHSPAPHRDTGCRSFDCTAPVQWSCKTKAQW